MFNNLNADKRVISIVVCILFSFLLPYHVHPFRAFYQELLPIFGIAIAVAICAENKTDRWQLVEAALLPILLAILIAAQGISGMLVSSADAVIPISYFLIAALAISIGAKFAAEEGGYARLVHGLAAACLLASIVSSVIATLQLVGAESILGSLAVQMPHLANQAIRAYANVSQPNQLALLFCMGIAAVWWFYQTRKIEIAAAAVLTLIILWGLALTQSRIGWLIIPIYSVCMVLWRTRITFKALPIIASVGLVAAYATIVALLPSIAVLLGGSVTSAAERAQTGMERIGLYQQAWIISLQHPWTGVGWFQFGPNQLRIAHDLPSAPYAEHSHNILLNLVAELGWPVGVALIAATIWWCVASYRCQTKTKEGGFSTLFFWAVGIHSMLEFPLWYAYVLMPTALLLGAAHQSQFGSKQITLPRWAAVVVSVVMAAGIVAVSTDYRRLVVGFRALGFENLGMVADEGSTNMPPFTMFPQFYDYFKFAKTRAHTGMTATEIAAMEHSAKRFGYAPVLMRMTMVYALNGRENDAVRTMETLRRLHPGNYADAYENWRQMSMAQPALYNATFRRFMVPSSGQPMQK